ncbi:MAG TPA: outer membrane beta-barrel protein [Gemmatimonadales bacterium]|nr:outer membrane beta-barrel protein [Gemmatimonadales bacterium]
MGTIRRAFPLVTALVVFAAGVAAGQAAPGRAGFWGAFGIGAGGEAYDLQDGFGYSEQLYRPTFSLRLGGTVNQHVRLGGEMLSWINQNGDAIESLTSALFIGQVYPFGSSGLYLKGGAGLGRNAVDFPDGSGLGDTGFAGLLGAGLEMRVSRRWYLNPTVDLVQHSYTGRGIDNYRERLVTFGMSILFQNGR